jgi:hypothetical protein
MSRAPLMRELPRRLCTAPDRFLVSVEVACRNHRQRAEFLGLLQEPYSSQDTDRGTETGSREGKVERQSARGSLT